MRFKEFIDIDSLRHAKITKACTNYKGDYKELSIAKPSQTVIKHIKIK